MNDRETYYWDALAQSARGKALDQLHANAANWVKALTALLGVLALVGVTLAPSAWDERELIFGGQDLTATAPWLLSLIFIGLLVSIWFAQAGSQTREQMVPFDAEGYRDYYRDASADAFKNVGRFRVALGLTAIPFVAYGLIGLLSQPKDPYLTLFQATTAAGLYCGKISEEPITGNLRLKTLRGKIIPDPTTQTPVITAITPVKNCFKRVPDK